VHEDARWNSWRFSIGAHIECDRRSGIEHPDHAADSCHRIVQGHLFSSELDLSDAGDHGRGGARREQRRGQQRVPQYPGWSDMFRHHYGSVHWEIPFLLYVQH
jgi:hypothetical protein